MLAILYDIHGNLPALEAVLADARGLGAESFVLGGDYALFGAFPSETVAALRQLGDATWIRGNVDRWSADPDAAPDDEVLRDAIAACRKDLGVRSVEELGRLEERAVVDGVLYCHASPISDLRSFMPDPSEEDDELLDGASERRVVFGHTHLPFRRVRGDGVELVNPGSVGLPFDGDSRAAYGVARDDGTFEHRRVAYDVEASVAGLSRFGDAEWPRRSAEWLRRARRES